MDAETTLDRVVRAEAADDAEAERFDASFELVLRLGRALLSFGLPAQRLEEALGRVAEALGLTVECFSTPTALIVSAGVDGETERTRLVRLDPGETDLERLSALHALVGRVERRELSPADASRRIDLIVGRTSRYGEATQVLGAGLAAAASALLLGGSANDLLPAMGLGTIVGGLAALARGAPNLGRVLPAIAALAVTVLAHAVAVVVNTPSGAQVHESVLVLASMIVLLPGFTLTIATLELATANLVSGTSRLVGGLAVLVQLGFGVAFGHRIASALLPTVAAVAPAAENPEWLVLGAHAMAAIAFAILLKAPPRDIAWILLGAAISVLGARYGRAWLGAEIGAFMGALSIGVSSHVYARVMDRPVLLTLLPGILMLVPGSVGFLSVSSMLAADTVAALETAFRMLLIATSLAAGLLVASLAVPPRRAL